MTVDDLLNRCLYYYEWVDLPDGSQELRDWLGMDRKHTDNVIELILTGQMG